MFKSLEFDDFVVAGIHNAKLNAPEWQADLPQDLRSKVVAIVEAPNWNESPNVAAVAAPPLPAAETILSGKSAFFGVTGVVAILCGVVFGFLFESSMIVYLCSTIAIVGIGAAVFLQSRAKGPAAAFRIALAPNDALARGEFVKHQMAIAEILKAVAKVGSISLLVLIVWQLSAIDRLTLGADDSLAAATIRLGTIGFIAFSIWSSWNSWKKGGAIFQIARCIRGLLARHLSPFWVSWLYEAKSSLAKPNLSERAHPTIMKVAMDNWPLLAISVFCAVCLANTQWLDGMVARADAARGERNGKWSWLNDMALWMHEHPTSTLWMVATVALSSIACFSYRLLKAINPQVTVTRPR